MSIDLANECYVAHVTDTGDKYLVSVIVPKNSNTAVSVEEGSKFIPLSINAQKAVTEALLEGKTVYIKKEVGYEATELDLEFDEDENLINVEKHKLRQKMNQRLIKSNILSTAFFDMFSFVITNNKLASEGYFITHENRDAKYIEVINTNNPELISTLEEYLIKFDKLTTVFDFYKKMVEITTELDEVSSEAELKTVKEKYPLYFE